MGKEIIVQLASPERYYTKCYHDFMDCNLLNGEEKIIFLALKRFLDVKSEQGKVFPTIETIQNMTGWGNQKVVKYINSLVKKGVVKKIRQGLSKPNIYILSDYSTMWTCDNVEDMTAVADNKGVRPLTPAEHIAELERMGYTIQIKEKELVSEPSKAHSQAQQNNNNMYVQNDTTKRAGSQERYSLEQIRQLYDYGILLQDNPDSQDNIDAVMSVLHTALNTEKETIRIAGEDRPAMSVISKLMKLTYLDIAYSLEKFSGQTERVKNPAAYLLTILYNAKEQSQLEATNRAAHDMAHGQ